MTTYKRKLAAICAVLALCFVFVIGNSAVVTFAAEYTAGSDVLADLSQDADFDIAAFPYQEDDHSLNVFQIAESTSKELLVYVYQPSAKTVATTIRFATQPNYIEGDNNELVPADVQFRDYPLRLQNHAGTLYKYKVLNFVVSDDAVRYYNIASIHRPWRSTDAQAGYNNTVDEVAYAVGQEWAAETVDGVIEYSYTTSEVRKIDNKHCGTLWYVVDKSTPMKTIIDMPISNFVAFSTDIEMDRLKKATVSYVIETIRCGFCTNLAHAPDNRFHNGATKWDSGDLANALNDIYGSRNGKCYNSVKTYSEVQNYEVDSDRTVAFTSGILKHNRRTYEWSEIMTTDDFVALHNDDYYTLTDLTQDAFQQTDYVLSFASTECVMTDSGSLAYAIAGVGTAFLSLLTDLDYDCTASRATAVTVLDLTYEKDGVTYKVGCVDNKQTGSWMPGGKPITNDPADWPDWVWWLIGGIILILIVVVLAVCVKPVGRVVLWLLKWLLKIVIYIVCAPFKFIAWCVKKGRERREAKLPQEKGGKK